MSDATFAVRTYPICLPLQEIEVTVKSNKGRMSAEQLAEKQEENRAYEAADK